MTFREISPARTFWPAALGLALVMGLAEAAFIFTARKGIAGAGFAILPVLVALVLLRFFTQVLLVRLETSATAGLVSGLRGKLLASLRDHAVPAYRPEFRRVLIHALREIAPHAGEGFLALARFRAAGLQACILLPCLLFFSWRLALLFLPLALTAFFVTRWRAHRLRNLERAERDSETKGRMILEDFGDGLETLLSGSVESSTSVLTKKFSRLQVSEMEWKRGQAYYPPLMELLFFSALAALVSIAQMFSILQGWDAWMVFSGLLLLAYRPVREAARHYPLKLQGAQALADIEKITAEWNAHPARAFPELSNRPGELMVLEKVDFGYGPRNSAVNKDPLVFRDYSADFDVHSITGIVGPNGAGKTTMLRLLSGVETPHRGSVLWPGSLRTQGGAAYLPQRIFLERDYSGWAEGFAARDPEFWSQLDSLLGLSRLLHGDFHSENLSGGEKQRLALARVLTLGAPFLLLDEPTSSLPGHEREKIFAGALTLWKNRKKVDKPRGALIVSHELFLGKYCDTLFSLEGVRAKVSTPA